MRQEELEIVYRDEWIVAVDKPAGQLVHPADVPQPGDVVTMKVLRDQLGQHVHAVHRIDRPTSGVLLFATDPEAARSLQIAFDRGQVEKIYWAVVFGSPAEEEWSCEEPLAKREGDPQKRAVTSFRLLEPLGDELSLVEARPETGRFHQIRRHLLAGGLPIVGDYRYAGIERCDREGERLGTGSRMLLQAKALRFEHPITEEPIVVEAPVASAIERVRNRG